MLINKIVHFSLHLFSFRNLGRVNHLLVFNFEGFEIGRYITSNVEDPRQAVLSPSAPYQRSHNRTKEAWKKVAGSNSGEQWIVPGEKPLRYMYMYAILKTRISVVVCIFFSGSQGGGGWGHNGQSTGLVWGLYLDPDCPCLEMNADLGHCVVLSGKLTLYSHYSHSTSPHPGA